MLNERKSRMSRARQALAEPRMQTARSASLPSRVTNYESQVTAYGSQITGRPLVKARAFQAREKQPYQNDGFSRGCPYSTIKRGDPALLCAHEPRVSNHGILQLKCHTMPSNCQRISLKTNGRHPHKVSHFFKGVLGSPVPACRLAGRSRLPYFPAVSSAASASYASFASLDSRTAQ